MIQPMTPDQEHKVCDALAAMPPAALYESLKKEAIVAVMFTLMCEEDKATEIFAQMEKGGIIQTELTPPGDPHGLDGQIPIARLKFSATHK